MCKILQISRSTYYFELNKINNEEKTEDYEADIISAFKESKNIYGARKIKIVLNRKGIVISRRKIRKIMLENGLVSKYTVLQYKVHKTKSNKDIIDNKVNREFDGRTLHEVVVSDLTYVNVSGKWNYICILIDLFNREIVGYSAGANKTADLVYKAFMSANISLKTINIFHTDRGNEFKNKIIDEVLTAFGIDRSLSKPGCPYDNAVAETTYKTFKTEFCDKRFETLEQLNLELFDYVNWYNNIRIHGSLGYLSPVEYRNMLSI